MPYEAEISRTNPTCFLFLIDQSGSMADNFGVASGNTKAQGVADAINRLLQTLVNRCAKGEYVLDRYHIGVIGYGSEISLGFHGELAGGVTHPVSAIADYPLRVEERVRRMDDGAGGLIEQKIKFPVWFEPVAAGRTLMCTAFKAAYEVISNFVADHPTCYPPILINVTDGMSTDGDPAPWATAIRNLGSSDGNVLLFNLHISARGEPPALFPSTDIHLPDDYARMLFHMSSPLPPAMVQQARVLELDVTEGACGFAFNADLVSVIMFLDIGTRVHQNLG